MSNSNEQVMPLSFILSDTRIEVQDYDYIEWSFIGNSLIQKREEFHEQIDFYKSYDNQHHLITKLLIDIIEQETPE
ncbi:unnamed protein product [Rotaria sp. Silwood2]|nr:unnamed protein product [Rotaria sp. Silwood2]CAF2851126.1 unnamed protein product [Rotaria sp. Silwood2]CAF3114162.1 unnamed protein product [Rotaria sp. Silwood2]CAF3921614.1 unnamed protein product [Rotaria sp. Silwood2]CAF3973722.1 unnamed protein product [Rotaria sp. Silwood2]